MTLQYAPDTTGYRPGVCNIGPEEIARRRRGGLTGIGIAMAIGLVLVLLGTASWTRILVFPFLAGGLVSLEQARRHFCVGFAMGGIRNFGPVGPTDHVSDASDRAADRRAALIMTGYMSAIAAVITAAFVLLPI